LIYLYGPHTLNRNCYLRGKKFLYFQLIYILEYIYITRVYNILLFLNILFDITLFNYTSKSTLITIGIIAIQCVLWARETRARFDCPIEV